MDNHTLFLTSLTPLPLLLPPPKRRRLPSRASAKAQQQLQLPEEIRVCTNRTCRRQGSFQTLETLSALAPPNVAVKPSGCLGRCGGGPNLVLLPDGLTVGHCGTAAQAAELMVSLFASASGTYDYDPKSSLDALALKKRAEIEFENRNFAEAELLLSQAIDLKPIGGIHVTFKCRSSVRLELGNYSGALEDAKEALMTVIFFWAMKEIDFFPDKFKVRHLSHHEMMSALYLQVSIVSQALIFVTRSRSWSYVEHPGLLLVGAFIIAQLGLACVTEVLKIKL